jgi:hypothetical protein
MGSTPVSSFIDDDGILHLLPLSLSPSYIFSIAASSSADVSISVQASSDWDCINPFCTTAVPHTCTNLCPKSRVDLSLPIINLQRFHNAHNPFNARLDIWEVVERLPKRVQTGLQVYSRRFGDVEMMERRVEMCPRGWKVFSILDSSGIMLAHVAVKDAWCEERSWAHHFKGILRFFTM